MLFLDQYTPVLVILHALWRTFCLVHPYYMEAIIPIPRSGNSVSWDPRYTAVNEHVYWRNEDCLIGCIIGNC